jgi:uncharacterized protein YndB with AHSA1/START domain
MTLIPPIRHTITVKASIARVWQALTNPAEVQTWVGAIGFKPEIGAKFEFHAPPREGWNGITYSELVSLEKPQKLAFTWAVPNFPSTLVEISLRQVGNQVEITLTHSGWEQFGAEIYPVRDELEKGWVEFVLPQLAKVVETI